MNSGPRGLAPAPRRRRFRRWRGGRRSAVISLGSLALLVAMAVPAPAAMAQAAPAQATARLLPSLPVNLPSPCVGGIVLCGDGTIKDPVPCVAGVCVPTPCVVGEVLCPGNLVGSPAPTASPTSSPTTGPTPSNNPNPPGGPGGPVAVAQAPLLAPPGVGIVAPVAPGPGSQIAGPAPGSLASLLSLSIGDGLSPGGAHLWPWLAALQVALLLAVLLVLGVKRLTAAAPPKD